MNWMALYVGVGIPVILVTVGYALVRYALWDARREP
jgi:hypothetical protein